MRLEMRDGYMRSDRPWLALVADLTGRGVGELAPDDEEVRTEPAVAKLCASAFEATWERVVPHDTYRPS